MTGQDAAGNVFPQTSNTESDPIREPESLDEDLDSLGLPRCDSSPELRILSINADEDRVSVGKEIGIQAYVSNLGGDRTAPSQWDSTLVTRQNHSTKK